MPILILKMDLRVLIIIQVFLLLGFVCPILSDPSFLLDHLYKQFYRKIWGRLQHSQFLFLFLELS